MGFVFGDVKLFLGGWFFEGNGFWNEFPVHEKGLWVFGEVAGVGLVIFGIFEDIFDIVKEIANEIVLLALPFEESFGFGEKLVLDIFKGVEDIRFALIFHRYPIILIISIYFK